MAEELLGVGFEIHGGGNDLAFPHHENEAAQTRMGRGAELAQIWMHNGMLQLAGGTMGKSLGNAIRLHEVIADVGRDALLMLFAGAHYRQPMAFDDERLAEAGARVARVRDAARRLADGDVAGGHAPLPRRVLRRARRGLQHARRRSAALFEWIREANRREHAGRPRRPRRDADGARPREPAERRRRRRADAEELALLDGASGGARREGLGARPTACATSSPRAAGRSATDPTGRARAPRPVDRAGRSDPHAAPEAVRGMILYGRNPVHEALRAGRRRLERVWATERAAREPWLRAVPDIQIVGARARSRAAAARPTTRASARRPAAIHTSAPPSCSRCADPFIVALDELQDPQNLGAICRTAECAGATGVVLCERRAAEVTPAAAKASAGAVEHLRIARVRNLADFLADAKAGRLLVLRRRRREPDGATTSPTTAAASCSSSAARERACARAWRKACDVLVSLPLRGRDRSR